jgi:hypothetical protein
MTKVEEAIAILQKLPHEKASVLAEAIIDATDTRGFDMHLSDEQAAEIERRMRETSPKFITLAEAQARLAKLGV